MPIDFMPTMLLALVTMILEDPNITLQSKENTEPVALSIA